MLEFRKYSDFHTFQEVYDDDGWEIGAIVKRNDKWKFAPNNNVTYYSYNQLEEIVNKLWSLNNDINY